MCEQANAMISELCTVAYDNNAVVYTYYAPYDSDWCFHLKTSLNMIGKYA